MDNLTEKKWFVYLGDRHEGPFSIDDIQEKMGAGQVTSETFVWTEGMTDWQIMRETQDFLGALGNTDPVDIQSSSQNLPSPDGGPAIFEEPTRGEGKQASDEKTGDLSIDDLKRAHDTRNPAMKKSWLVLPSRKRMVTLLLLGAGAYSYLAGYFDPVFKNPVFEAGVTSGLELIRPYLLELSEKSPYLEQWISPLPQLDNVDSLEMEELKKAARAKSDTAKVALALSQVDSVFPSFYLASNLPDGARFQVSIIGIPQTLLNRSSFSAQVAVTVNKKIGQSSIVRMPDGRPLPRGEYLIIVSPAPRQLPQLGAAMSSLPESLVPLPSSMSAELPKDIKILISKTYFLGGKRDPTYQARLADYHGHLRVQAAGELADLKQFAVTLENQLESSNSKFALLSKSGPSRQRRSWEVFHNEWSRLQTQLNDIFQKWNPEVLQNDFFYGPLYALVQNANQGLERVHSFQQEYFTSVLVDPKAFQIQLDEAISSARGAISMLKTKIDQAEKVPPTPNGMPQREGL